jgi:hypothetical protein
MSDLLNRFAAKDPRVQDAPAESALVNARVLAYFLSKKPGVEGVAGEFLPTWTPRSDPGRLIGVAVRIPPWPGHRLACESCGVGSFDHCGLPGSWGADSG